MNRMLRTLALALALGSTAALAQTPAPGTLPPGVFAGERDIALATAGTYTLDEQHTAVIVRGSHIRRRSRNRSSRPRSRRPPSRPT